MVRPGWGLTGWSAMGLKQGICRGPCEQLLKARAGLAFLSPGKEWQGQIWEGHPEPHTTVASEGMGRNSDSRFSAG